MLVVSELSGCVCIAVAQGGCSCGSGPAWPLQIHTRVDRPKAYGLKQLGMEKCHCLCPLLWALAFCLPPFSKGVCPNHPQLCCPPPPASCPVSGLGSAWPGATGTSFPRCHSCEVPYPQPSYAGAASLPCPAHLCRERSRFSLCSPQLIPLKPPLALVLGAVASAAEERLVLSSHLNYFFLFLCFFHAFCSCSSTGCGSLCAQHGILAVSGHCSSSGGG